MSSAEADKKAKISFSGSAGSEVTQFICVTVEPEAVLTQEANINRYGKQSFEKIAATSVTIKQQTTILDGMVV